MMGRSWRQVGTKIYDGRRAWGRFEPTPEYVDDWRALAGEARVAT